MLTWLILSAASSAPFTFVEEAGGIRVEAREVSGSSFVELRLRTTSAVSVDVLCDEAFGDGSIPPGDPYLRERRVLQVVSRDERVTYDRVTAPLVSDRDYALRTRRERASGTCTVRFELAPEAAPPPVRGMVRLPRLRGAWSFARGASGLTEVTYTAHSEPGGDITALLAEGPRRRTEVDVVRRLLLRATHPR
jgi:hypothetical protein